MNLAKNVEALEANFQYLTEGQRKFADSLINGKYGYKARPGKFSEKQEKCIDGLLDTVAAKKAGKDAPQKTESIGNLTKLYRMFQQARDNGLKYPKLHLEINDHVVQLSVSGNASKYPGQVNATDGQPFGHNKWYGRVDASGTWTQGREYPELEDVSTLLRSMSHDPQGTAEAFGHLTGRCCFCNRPLKDEKSTSVGYGPVCATKWGLNWG